MQVGYLFTTAVAENGLMLLVSPNDGSGRGLLLRYRDMDHLEDALSEAGISSEVLDEPQFTYGIDLHEIMILSDRSLVDLFP